MAYRETEKVLAKKEQTRLGILKGASSLVRRERPVTMDAVAAEAGISVGSIYTYFRNRADLMVALFEWRADAELTAMVEILQGDAPAAELVSRATATTLRRGLANPGMTLFLLMERMDRDPRLELAKLNYHRRHCDALAEIIRRGIDEGTMRCRHADVAAAAVLGTIIEVLSRALTGTDDTLARLSGQELEEELCETILAICRALEDDASQDGHSVH